MDNVFGRESNSKENNNEARIDMQTIVFSPLCVSRLRVHTDSFNVFLTTHFFSRPAGASHDIHLALKRFYLQPAKREQSKRNGLCPLESAAIAIMKRKRQWHFSLFMLSSPWKPRHNCITCWLSSAMESCAY